MRLTWWNLVPSSFGLIFKFKAEQERAVIGLDMTTSSSSGLGFKIYLKKPRATLRRCSNILRTCKGCMSAIMAHQTCKLQLCGNFMNNEEDGGTITQSQQVFEFLNA